MYLHEIKDQTVRRVLLVIGFPALFVGAMIYGFMELANFSFYVWNVNHEDE